MYLAPEMLTDDGMHDFKVDWWAYGVLIFILLTFEVRSSLLLFACSNTDQSSRPSILLTFRRCLK